jgi:hypothetical protein
MPDLTPFDYHSAASRCEMPAPALPLARPPSPPPVPPRVPPAPTPAPPPAARIAPARPPPPPSAPRTSPPLPPAPFGCVHLSRCSRDHNGYSRRIRPVYLPRRCRWQHPAWLHRSASPLQAPSAVRSMLGGVAHAPSSPPPPSRWLAERPPPSPQTSASPPAAASASPAPPPPPPPPPPSSPPPRSPPRARQSEGTPSGLLVRRQRNSHLALAGACRATRVRLHTVGTPPQPR